MLGKVVGGNLESQYKLWGKGKLLLLSNLCSAVTGTPPLRWPIVCLQAPVR